MNKEKLVMYFRIKILQMNGPNYKKKYPGVRVSKGKRRSVKKYLPEKEIKEVESEHKSKIESIKSSYNKMDWI